MKKQTKDSYLSQWDQPFDLSALIQAIKKLATAIAKDQNREETEKRVG